MGTGTHHHDTAFSIVKALGIVAVVISHAAILTPLETFTYYFNTAVFFFVAGYFFDDGQTAAPGRFIGRKLRRLYLPYVALGTLFVLLHNRFLEWHLIAYDFSAREAILPYDTPELLRTLGRVFLFLHHEQMLAPFWFLQGLFLGLMLFFCITLATRKLAPTQAGAERLRGGSILFLFTVAMLLARHPSGIPGEWIAVRTFAITGIIYLGKLFRIFRARIPLDGLLLQQGDGVAEKLLALRRELHAPVAAGQHPNAQFVLKLPHRRGNPRLGQEQLLGRLVDGAAFGDLHDVLKLLKRHRKPPLPLSISLFYYRHFELVVKSLSKKLSTHPAKRILTALRPLCYSISRTKQKISVI